MVARRAFILEPHDLGEQRLTAALEAVDGIEAAGTSRARRTILDTFDWRLHDLGLLLEADAGGDRLRCTLRRHDGTVEAQQQLAELPRFLRDLPHGPLRARLEPIIDVRALLPRATVALGLRHLHHLNADDKTISRLTIEQATLVRKGQGDLDLGVRLRVDPVRGYDRPTTKLVARLSAELDLVERPERLAHDAIIAAGHQPDAERPPGVRLTPDEPADVALADLLGMELGEIERNTTGVIDDIDTECLHDLRVAVRRTRSLLRLAGGTFPAYQLEPHQRTFAELGQATGRLRDLDVYLLDFDIIAGHVPEEHRADLDPLHELLVTERADELAVVRALLRSTEHRRRMDDWRAFLNRSRHGATSAVSSGADDGGGRNGDGAATPTAIGTVAATAIDRAQRRLVTLGRTVSADAPAEQIHKLRKRGKELRYAIANFASLYDPDDVDVVLKRLRRLQNVLGAFQDGEIQVAAIEQFARIMDERRLGSPDALMTMGLLRSRFAAVHDEARAEVVEAFEAFDRPEVADRLAILTAAAPEKKKKKGAQAKGKGSGKGSRGKGKITAKGKAKGTKAKGRGNGTKAKGRGNGAKAKGRR